MKTSLLLPALLLAAAFPLAADRAVSADPRMDWPGARVIIEASTPLDPRLSDVSKARYQAELEIRQALPGLLQTFLQELPLDSWQTVGQRLRETREPAAGPEALPGRVLYSRLSPDFREVRVRYEAPLYGEEGLMTRFVTHERPFPPPRFLGFAPSRAATGLIIYARGLLPVYPARGASATEARVRPAVFFRLYDPGLDPVLEKEMCDPAALKRWGMAAYAYELPPAASAAQRVGEAPLRVMARGVFGRNSTDIVLSEESARLLLGREENRRLLQEGRILIIVDPPS